MAQPRRIPWVIAGGGLAVVTVVVVVVLTTSGSDTSSPENVAQAAVDTVNDKRPDDIRSLACAEVRGDTDWSVNLKGAVAEVRNVAMDGDHHATADLRFTDPTGDPYIDMRMDLTEKNDEWCISKFEGWNA